VLRSFCPNRHSLRRCASDSGERIRSVAAIRCWQRYCSTCLSQCSQKSMRHISEWWINFRGLPICSRSAVRKAKKLTSLPLCAFFTASFRPSRPLGGCNPRPALGTHSSLRARCRCVLASAFSGLSCAHFFRYAAPPRLW
jgi:hypothetical protein